MNSRFPSLWGRLLVPALLVPAAGCGGGGGGGSSGMSIEECSLGCTNSGGNPGSQISCGVTDVWVNQEIWIDFTGDIDPTTVSNNSFQVTEVGTGKTPAGTFSLAPGAPSRLIYRPQLTFDSAGFPIFGLTEGKTYLFKVPGVVLDPLGPYIRNTTGTPNKTRLQCTLVASRGVLDAKPGRPRVTVTVDTVKTRDQDGNPIEFNVDFPAPGAEDVYRNSPVRMVFDDLMNPATLANPVTGESTFITAFVDADGDVSDQSDRVPLDGSFTLTLDQAALRTTLIFTPAGGLPSAGSNLSSPRKIVIVLSPQIADLGGNPLINPQTLFFTPEKIDFEPLVIEEPFVDPARRDSVRSGSAWGAGLLAKGPGGGSGRLGDLVVLAGQTVTLNTDNEDFSAITNPAVFNPVNVIDRPANLHVTDGVFEFARLRVDAGGVLRFVGSNAARIYVRGECVVEGVIDVSGGSGVLHDSTTPFGGLGGEAGAGGGAGGDGGSRPDGTNFQTVGGTPNPTVGPSDVLDPATYVFVNGGDGGGVPFPNTLAPTDSVAAGTGGLGWPQPTAAAPGLHMPRIPADVGGLQPEIYQECRYMVPAAPGGGGGYALDGGIGDLVFGGIPPFPTLAPDAPGGDSDDLQIDDAVRSLSPLLGYLRGGGGGGGGGAHIQRTIVNGLQLVNCSIAVPQGSPLRIAGYFAHSSAGGGGGAGGVQLAAGRRIILNGVINASGGDGGSGTFPPSPANPNNLAQAGGGGAGGSVLLQSPLVQIQAIPNRINIAGGEGGEGVGSPFPLEPSTGGRGSPGLLRIESTPAPTLANEESKINPLESVLKQQYGITRQIEDIFSVADWTPVTDAPDGWSGAQSCWIRPTGNFFRLAFEDDVGGLGWDMRLLIVGQANPQSYRGDNDLLPPGTSLEQAFGVSFGTAPVLVRFQGARASGVLIDPCSVPETGVASPLAAGSLTDWVSHPQELNDFFGDESLTPNIFRFVILWDASQPEFPQIQGVEDLTVTIQPD